jgi:hypothetical protein
MTIKYYMRPDSNTPPMYSYHIGKDTDSSWNPTTCIEVTPQPTVNHVFNWNTMSWELSEAYYMADLRAKRNKEIARTDKYMFEDFPIESTDITTVMTYRQALRDCPNKALISDRILPDCPNICKE